MENKSNAVHMGMSGILRPGERASEPPDQEQGVTEEVLSLHWVTHSQASGTHATLLPLFINAYLIS